MTPSARTATQTYIAKWWQSNPVASWNDVARQLIARNHLDAADSARLLAMQNLAAADAAINTWNDKYHFSFWRPFQAIRRAADDGNPATSPDPTWTPLLAAPYPDHVSGHLGLDGSHTAVLRSSSATHLLAATRSRASPSIPAGMLRVRSAASRRRSTSSSKLPHLGGTPFPHRGRAGGGTRRERRQFRDGELLPVGGLTPSGGGPPRAALRPRSLDHQLAVGGRDRDPVDARPVVGHSDRQLVATEPRAESLGVSAHLDPPRPVARTPCPTRARPGCSSSEMSQMRKNGIQASRRGSSSPAIRQRTVWPSGRVLDPDPTSSPSRDATASRSSATAAIVNQPPPPAARSSTPLPNGSRQPPARPPRHELQVLITQRHDPVRRPPALVPPALGRIQSELLAEPDRGLIEIGTAHTTWSSRARRHPSRHQAAGRPGRRPGQGRLASADELQVARTELGERRRPAPSAHLVEDVLEVLPDG